jgi:PRC-barrel domain
MSTYKRTALIGSMLVLAAAKGVSAEPGGADQSDRLMQSIVMQAVAAGAAAQAAAPDSTTKADPSPEERMNQRFPQPIRAGDLIGLPVLDYDDRTIGHVRHVVRTPQGRIQLIVTQGGWPTGWFDWRARLVPVPIEAVAILGRQLAALDMTREEFAAAPTWSNADGEPIAPNDMIRIALTRR